MFFRIILMLKLSYCKKYMPFLKEIITQSYKNSYFREE